MSFDNIRGAIQDIADGRMVILMDDEDRENEGDLCMAAEKITPEAINFMASEGRGLVCLTLTEARIAQLKLPMMVRENHSAFQTGFTISIEAREGVSTGISASDRARTILTAVSENAGPEDLVSPGHVFPIRARDGGVLVRTGQTEGSVDLARLAGLVPAGVICEIMNPDGSMARRPELERFGKKHGLRIVTVAELVAHRFAHESLVQTVCEKQIQTRSWGPVTVRAMRSLVDGQEHLVLVKGEIRPEHAPLVRVQSIELPADLLGLTLFEGGAEMQAAMAEITREGCGVFVYLVRTASEVCLSEKLKGVEPQGDPHQRTGSGMDLRAFGTGAQILKAVGVRRFRLLTNSAFRMVGLQGFGLTLTERVPLPLGTFAGGGQPPLSVSK